MYTINRSIAIIRPKRPFVDWANQLPDAEFKSSLDDFKTDCLAVLIPDYDSHIITENNLNDDNITILYYKMCSTYMHN